MKKPNKITRKLIVICHVLARLLSNRPPVRPYPRKIWRIPYRKVEMVSFLTRISALNFHLHVQGLKVYEKHKKGRLQKQRN
jgi:hypothetical protein